MVYTEISQILSHYGTFVNNSKSTYFKQFLLDNPEWEEQDELKEFKKLADWYNIFMKSHDVYESIKKYDEMVRSQLPTLIVG